MSRETEKVLNPEIMKQTQSLVTFEKTDDILQDMRGIIDSSRDAAYRAVNVTLIRRNWLIGYRISEEELSGENRAEYGASVIARLSKELSKEYGKGFTKTNLYSFYSFYKTYPQIFQTPSGKSQPSLTWSHYAVLLQVPDSTAREWYAKEADEQMWSVRTLQRNISSQYYYRMLQTQKPELVESEMRAKTSAYAERKLEFIKNPVVAEFLGLSGDATFTETDLETSIISNLQKFLMELGKGYAFVARQQHIRTEKQDYYIDLVFYNYILKCFVLIDLKTEKITHQDVGQMDMYIRMYDELKRSEGDNPTIGIVLCSDTDADIARYSILNGNEQLFATKYKLYLPTEEELRAEIETQKAIFYLQQQKGKDADDLVIRVPRGTVLKEAETGLVVADLSGDAPVVVAKGGRGGWGNARFATPTRQIPRFAKPGLPGEDMHLTLELKVIADVGLIGFPNVGKSTLISTISAARPKIANYHFTTLTPVLGVVRVGPEQSFVCADIPGLIEGAADGVGLGHDFLRHVERCRLLLHVVDVSGCEGRDPKEDFEQINHELEGFSADLATRPQIVLGNKCDIATPEQVEEFKQFVEAKGLTFVPISAATRQGVDALPALVYSRLKELPPVKVFEAEYVKPSLVDAPTRPFTVERTGAHEFTVDAPWLERILAGTNVEDYESLQYFQTQLGDSGILDELVRQNVEEDDTIKIGEYEFDYVY